MTLAHAGHYATSGLLFAAVPVLLFLLMLTVAWIRARRQRHPN